jgi:hypothetical protein
VIMPATSFDFTTGVLDPRVTLTRALNTATHVNSSGLIELINADLPRFDYDPVTLAIRGLLIEDLRTNLVVNSSLAGTGGINPTSWIRFQGTDGAQAVSTLADAGTSNAWTFTANVNRQAIYQVISVAANTTYYATVYVEQASVTQAPGNVFSLAFLPAGATSTYEVSNTTAGSRMRIRLDVGATAGTVQFRIGLGVGGNVTGTITLSCPQLEAGAVSTSYIPTTSAAVTRNADVATITGTNFSDFWQASKGGAQVLALPSTVSGIRPLVQYDDGTADNIIALRGNAANPELQIVDGGAPQAQIDAGTIAANTDYSLTGWWATNDCKARLNSGAVVTDTSATIPTVTQARLGSDGTNYLNGHLASISYYDSFSEQIYTRRKNKAVFNLM